MVIQRNVLCEECKGKGEFRKPKWKLWRKKKRCDNCKGTGIVKMPVEIDDLQSVKSKYYSNFKPRHKPVEHEPPVSTQVENEEDDTVVQAATLMLQMMEQYKSDPIDPEPERGGLFGGAGASGSWEEENKNEEISSHEEVSSSSDSQSSDSGSDNNNNGGC